MIHKRLKGAREKGTVTSHNLCVDQARILGDCYGVDIYTRLLLDIRGVYDAETLR